MKRNNIVGDVLLEKMMTDVDVFGAARGLGVEGLLDGALVVLKERNGRRCSIEEFGEEVAKVQSLLHSFTQSYILGLRG